MPAADTKLRLVVGATSGLVGVTAIATAGLALIASIKPAWFLFGFEAILLFPVVMGLLFFRRKWDDPTGLGLGCLAGTLFCASTLAYLSVAQGRLGTVDGPVGQINLRPWLAFRVLAALAIGAAAVRMALGSERDRWVNLARGVVLGAVSLGIAAALYKFRASIMPAGEDSVSFPRIGAAIVAGVVMLAGLCAAVHFTMNAFDRRVPAPSLPPA